MFQHKGEIICTTEKIQVKNVLSLSNAHAKEEKSIATSHQKSDLKTTKETTMTTGKTPTTMMIGTKSVMTEDQSTTNVANVTATKRKSISQEKDVVSTSLDVAKNIYKKW